MFQPFCRQDDIFKHTKEIPATIPVYEGYLYWYSDKQKWKWHLFRFDGLSFICLSSRKVKLPCDTPIEPLCGPEGEPTLDDPEPTLSPTSPLLATPKKYPHAPYAEDTVVMASHYQLPSWSVNLLQVTSISLLTAPHNDKNLSLQQQQQQQQQQQSNNCFCLRTLDKKCFLLKARKHKDLDRWLFILTKAWDWTRIQRQRQEEYQHYQQELKCPSLPPQLPPLNISSFDLKSRKSNEPPTPPPHFCPPSPLLLLQQDQGEYDTNYTNIILSPEKEKWIDEWRDSIKLTITTSPEVINKPSSQPIPDPQHISYTTEPQQPPFICVKKKRSDEVKNWISSNYQTQDHQDYDVHYFQDAHTTTDQANDTSSSNQHNSHHSKDKTTPPSPPSLHYHRSTRGKSIQIVNHDPKITGITTINTTNTTTTTTLPSIPLQPISTPPFDNHSPLHTLSKAESTQDIYNLQSTYQHHRQSSIPVDYFNPNDRVNNRPVSIATSHYYPQRVDRTTAIVAPSIPPEPTTSSYKIKPLSLIKQNSNYTSWNQGSSSLD